MLTTDQWINLFAPVLAIALPTVAAGLAVVVSGLGKKVGAWFASRGDADAATAVAAATTSINTALMTGAGTLAGKIQTGQVDWTNRASWVEEARREVQLAISRVPQAVAIAKPVEEALVANLMSKVDALVVASPTIGAAPPVVVEATKVPPSAPMTVSAAVQLLAQTQSAMSGVVIPQPAGTSVDTAALKLPNDAFGGTSNTGGYQFQASQGSSTTEMQSGVVPSGGTVSAGPLGSGAAS